MNWLIPAKTFLIGEYSALAEASALVVLTDPYFQLTVLTEKALTGIHPESPAGLWWQQQNPDYGLSWHDPHLGRGGMGASSAQFLGSYLASCFIKDSVPALDQMLGAYYKTSWTGKGLRPSGYDVIAQSQQGCVYINKQKKVIESYSWPFQDLSFFLIHTGIKLATHHHLQNTDLPDNVDYLSQLVDEAKKAFEYVDPCRLIKAINGYHQKLASLNLVAEHSLQMIHELKKYPEILAVKGCGALGADVLLILTSVHTSQSFAEKLKKQNRTILATEKNIHFQGQLIQPNLS
ncbi:Uncharacterised protein [Legionella wadsworthii]|uniref:Mevalonate kinase n=1 Tax=Legionella wadsworthii TaxID=28088 RepID=A0A378LVD8_9GAMM|nr:hypothetical protein [Legionella wadsworthii]STY29799.1 Uncharacterised protein [Legionella wadsworthii]